VFTIGAHSVARDTTTIVGGLLVAVLSLSPVVAAGPGSLAGPWQVTLDEGAALAAAVDKVRALGYRPDEFAATVECGEAVCEVRVYPQELDTDPKYRSYRGCPLKYCATLTYSTDTKTVIREVGWR
jgi:hypothetical protein